MNSDMRPSVDSTDIQLPITFDYSGGRSDSKKTRVLSGIVLLVVWLFTILICILGDMNIFLRFLVPMVMLIAFLMLGHYVIMRGRYYGDLLKDLERRSFSFDSTVLWGIFEVEGGYPHFVRFRNGDKGLFVRLEKDVIVGKTEDAMFEHYEAISEAYNKSGSVNVRLVHIDYMENVGMDKRLVGMYDSLDSCDNEDLKRTMMSIYANLEDEMRGEYSSHDVYLFLSKDRDDTFWYNTQAVVSELMKGNYVTFKVLGSEGIKELTASLYNLEDFSVVEACDRVYSGGLGSFITPIHIIRNGSMTKISKTSDEILNERKILESEKAMKKGKFKSMFKRGNKKDLDVFED